MRIRIFLFAALLTALPVYSQYDVDVTEIAVWVHVLDSAGNPLQGLTIADFELKEDGQVQTLTCFEEKHQVFSAQETANTQQNVPRRKIVLFLDLLNTSTQEYLNAQTELQSFLTELEQKNWEIMLAALTKAGKLGIIAPFTRDYSSIRTVLQKAPANDQRDTKARKNFQEMQKMLQIESDSASMGGRQSSESEGILQAAFQATKSYAREEQAVSELSLAALESLGNHVISKKTDSDPVIILIVSGGFSAEPGSQYYELLGQYVGLDNDELRVRNPQANVAQGAIRERLQQTVGRLSKQNITFYSVNTRGMYAPKDTTSQTGGFNFFKSEAFKDYQEPLARMAEETGGMSFQNSQNFEKGFSGILNDLSYPYELCYKQPAHKEKGKYHKIEVRVKRDNVRVRHRRGYID